jgi:DNA polymerase I-like protein with 3'-5' exonuclease and polymerase domains
MNSSTTDLALYIKAPWYALDTETLSLNSGDPHHLRTIQLAAPGLPTIFFDRHFATPEELKLFDSILRSLPGRWFAHNAAFDYFWLQTAGCLPAGTACCTMLAARLITMGLPNISVSLKEVTLRFLKRELNKELQSSDWSGVLTDEQRTYAIEDANTLAQLVPILLANIKTANLADALALECLAIPAVVAMQRNGLPFDAAHLRALIADLAADEARSRDLALQTLDDGLPDHEKLPRLLNGDINEDKKKGFNVGSPAQLQRKFTALLGAPILDPDTGKPSVAKAALREYTADHPAIYHYANWKRYNKYGQLATALLTALGDGTVIRSGYMQLGADTGRFSCREPNLQQVPRDKRFRSAAVAPPGWSFVVADYSQLELRLIAAASRDTVMIDAFRHGLDLHSITAATIYGVEHPTSEQRQVGKSANFGLAYGAGARGLRIYAGSCGITMSIDEATAIRDTWLGLYSGVAAWIAQAGRDADDDRPGEKAVRIPITGHRRILKDKSNRMTVRTNTPIQGAGAAIIKKALARIQLYIEADTTAAAKLCACIHDEIVLLAKDEAAPWYKDRLVEFMEEAEAPWLTDLVPCEVTAGIGASWASAK